MNRNYFFFIVQICVANSRLFVFLPIAAIAVDSVAVVVADVVEKCVFLKLSRTLLMRSPNLAPYRHTYQIHIHYDCLNSVSVHPMRPMSLCVYVCLLVINDYQFEVG